MSLARALRDEITVFNRSDSGNTDRYGNPLDEDDEGTTVRASVQPLPGPSAQATENEINRDTRVSRYRFLVSPDVEISALSRVEWKGESFEVVGRPELFSYRSGEHHKEFDGKLVEG